MGDILLLLFHQVTDLTMSTIDTFDHSYVGFFNHVPLYHPLEKGDMDYFEVNSQNLVIGGGSGEHPSMMVENLNACLGCFLESFLDFESSKDKKDEFLTFLDSLDGSIGLYNVMDNLQMGGWDMATIGHFHVTLDEHFKKINAIPKTHDSSRYSSDEEKIQIMLGEFLYFSGRSLLSESVNTLLNEQEELLQGVVFPIFCAIERNPKGYPISGGYFDKSESKRVYGLSFLDEDMIYYSQNPRTVSRKLKP